MERFSDEGEPLHYFVFALSGAGGRKGDFGDATLVTAALEGGGEEDVDDVAGFLVGNEAGGEAEDVGIVVATGEVGELHVPAEGATDALVLVDGHGYAVATAAEDDAAVVGAGLDGGGEGMGRVGVVHAVGGMGAEVGDEVAPGAEVFNELLLVGKSGMVGRDGYFHGWNVL